MAASSVEFSACRVQLMGLPRSSSSHSASDASSSIVNSSRPFVAKIKGVSRNLFGTPDRDEMKNLFQQEAERQHSYILKRYNFDTKTSKPTYDKEQQPTDKSQFNQTTKYPAIQPTPFPTLIQQELVQHEQRLHDEEQNLNRSLEISTPNDTKSDSKVSRRYLAHTHIALERQKPYTRQHLLKESFNIRKNKVCVRKNGKQCNGELRILENSPTSHRNLEVLQLPQPINSQLPKNAFDVKNNAIESSANGGVSERKQERVGSNQSCNENCTTFSLQLVVSTRNVS